MGSKQNYLSLDLQTGEIHRIYGCANKQEAEEFINKEYQELLILSDEAINSLKSNIIEE